MRFSLYSTFCRALLLFLALVSLASERFFSSFLVAGDTSFQCQDVWDSPSANNDLIDCFLNWNHLKSQWRSQLFIYVCISVLALVLFVIPFVCCGCFCYCPCYKRRAQDRSYYCKGILLSIIVFIGAIGVGIMLISSGVVGRRTVLDVFDDMKGNLLDFVTGRKDEIAEYLVNYASGTPVEPSIDLSEFDKVVGDVRDIAEEYNDVVQYSATGYLLVGVIGGAFVFFLSLISLVATSTKAVWCACCFGWFMYIFVFFFCALALVFAFVAFAIAGLCGEVELQRLRFPGIFQWYLLPWLDDVVDFTGVSQTIRDMEATASQEACASLLTFCSPEGTTSTEPFVCPDGFTSSSSCKNFRDLESVYDEITMKPSLIDTYCPAPESYEGTWTCSINNCTEYCINDNAKKASKTISSLAEYANNASVSVSLILPLVNGDFILDVVSSLLVSKQIGNLPTYTNRKITRCSDLHASIYVLTTGFFVGGILLLFGLLAIIWIRNPKVEGDQLRQVNPLGADVDYPQTLTLKPVFEDDYEEARTVLNDRESKPISSTTNCNEEGILVPVVSWY